MINKILKYHELHLDLTSYSKVIINKYKTNDKIRMCILSKPIFMINELG